jgi:hypothetical protein
MKETVNFMLAEQKNMRTNVSEARKVGVLEIFMGGEDMTLTWNSILRL